jgi:hypothetical protein
MMLSFVLFADKRDWRCIRILVLFVTYTIVAFSVPNFESQRFDGLENLNRGAQSCPFSQTAISAKYSNQGMS